MIETSAEEWSDFQITLSRKTNDTIIDLVTKYENGDISKEEFITSCKAIYDCVSGLAEWDVLDSLDMIFKEYG